MRKFYFYAQLFATPIVPVVFVFSPTWLNLQSGWPTPLSMIVLGLILLFGLFFISLLTLRTSQLTGVRELSVRLSVLLETIYVSVIALLLTTGIQGEESQQSAVVSVLTDRGFTDSEAWFASDVARTVLLILIFFFLIVAFFSAAKERVAVSHRTVHRYQILDADEISNQIITDALNSEDETENKDKS